ncbi:MAG: 2-oxoacid:acceptor oxidoreductase family protein [Acetobacteraceae bacterium]
MFYGLGADGTVGANKNSVKIIAEDAGLYAQGYFVYDSHKSGAQTISHLRFGPTPIKAPYLVAQAGFVACHQFGFLERQNILRVAAPGATFLINAPYAAEEVWGHLPRPVQRTIIEKALRLFVIDASAVARQVGLGVRRTLSSRPASSPSPACCRGSGRSPTSRRRSARPTGQRGNRSSTRISPPSMAPCCICTK